MNHSPAAWVLAILMGFCSVFVANDIRKILKEGGYWGARSRSYISRDEAPGKFRVQIYLRIFFALGATGLALIALLARSVR